MGKFEIDGEEVVERNVKATGNGAHVYVPKDWIDDSVKVVRLKSEVDSEFEQCDVCNRNSSTCQEWCWIDEGGGAFFMICQDCRSEVGTQQEDVCSVCGEDNEISKSAGFGPVGPDSEHYKGCDKCRSRIIFEDQPGVQPVWIE
jgi:putative transposon-encoded protein